jgi:hypothetical protein
MPQFIASFIVAGILWRTAKRVRAVVGLFSGVSPAANEAVLCRFHGDHPCRRSRSHRHRFVQATSSAWPCLSPTSRGRVSWRLSPPC